MTRSARVDECGGEFELSTGATRFIERFDSDVCARR